MPSERLRRLQSKSLHGQFRWELENEFELSPREAGAVVETARNIYNLDRLKIVKEQGPGQVERIVVSQHAQHGPPMEALEKVKVTVTLDGGEADQQVGRTQGATAMRQKRMMRMVEEANAQGGSLSQEDLADLLQVSVRTIQRDIAGLKEDGMTVSTRGIMEDIGSAISHKTTIVELYLQGYTYSEIARRSRHQPFSIQRYLTHFGQVVLLTRKELTGEEIRFGVGISGSLVQEYQRLYHRYDTPEYAQRLEDLITIRSPSESVAKKGGLAS